MQDPGGPARPGPLLLLRGAFPKLLTRGALPPGGLLATGCHGDHQQMP